MADPTPEQLVMELVRRFYPEVKPGYRGRRYQIALAAIIETSERAAKMVGGGYRSVDPVETESPVQWNRRSIIAAIRRGDHLDD